MRRISIFMSLMMVIAVSFVVAIVMTCSGKENNPIFCENHSIWVSQFFGTAFDIPQPEKISMIFTGDNLLAGRMTNHIEWFGRDYPYEKVVDYFHEADLVFGNLENPLTAFDKPTPGKSVESIEEGRNFIFKGMPSHSGILKDAGFDIVSLANNHAMDYQEQGLNDTFNELDKLGIAYVGAGRNKEKAANPVIMNVENWRIGFLAYSMIVPPRSRATESSAGINPHKRGYSDKMGESIRLLKREVDLVVVSYHWGVEGSYYPTDYQKDVARRAIDDGADIIIGHHPHAIQGMEFYNGGLIAYSLGNFLFTGKSHKIESVILRIEFDRSKIRTVEMIPVWVINGKPEPSTDPVLLRRIEEVNRPFENNFKFDKYRFVGRLW